MSSKSKLDLGTMMVLTDGLSKLEIDLISWDGDAYVTVAADSRGYSGSNDLHILGEDFRKFCAELLKLQVTLKGETCLNSVTPEELTIRIGAFDALGHISVVGKCGRHIQTVQSMNWHSVEFGFEIEPQQLDEAVKVQWVRDHAI